MSVGYSLARTEFGAGSTNLNGFDIDYTVKPRFRSQWMGVIVDLSQYFGSAPIPLAGFCRVPRCITPNVNSNVKMFSLQSGLRFTRTGEKLSPFAKVLVGSTSVFADGTGTYPGLRQSTSGLSYAAGLGSNLRLTHAIGWKFEGDFLQMHLWGNFRYAAKFTTGPVFSFGLAP